MKIDSLIEEAVDMCMWKGIPFVFFALPGEEDFKFYAARPREDGSSPAFRDDDSDSFYINFFDNDEPYTAGVPFDMDAAGAIEYANTISCGAAVAEIHPRVTPTFRASYHEAFSRVVSRLKKDGGKTVLSRIRSIFSIKTIFEIANEYFSVTSSTFRYLCFTHETGLWLGSTPELLLESDKSENVVRTMALAGTRGADESGEWDSKNLSEHGIVAAYIATLLANHGLDVTIGDLGELRFINIVHLCTPIEAKGSVDVKDLLALLSPTPAVAGYPPEIAKEEIGLYETHRRHCYGGYVGVRINGDYLAFVNLRCAFMERASFSGSQGLLVNLYVGGGIMADSTEECEWQETEAKSTTLAAILLGDNSVTGVEGQTLLNPETVSFLHT